MTKKLTQLGNSLALILDKPILELLGADRDTEFSLRLEGDRLVVTPLRPGWKKDFDEALTHASSRHRGTPRKLAR
jgi:antitoxin component of MazEF toxin-antitoxin module